MFNFIFTDNIKAIFDTWIIGDDFLQDLSSSYDAIRSAAAGNPDKNMYLLKYYNVKLLYKLMSAGVHCVIARIINSLIDGFNMNDHLPRFIVVIIDHDIIKDVDVFDRNAHKTIGDNVHWLVHQIDILVKRKKAEIQVKRPGALFVGDPKIIFVRMLRRVGKPFYHGSKLEALHGHRAKFNDALNEAVAQIDQKNAYYNSLQLICPL